MLLLIKQRCALHRNEQGFTLIEALLALTVFSVLAFYMTPMLQILLINIDSKPDIQKMEWEVFGSQVKKEIRASSKAQIISGKLYLTKEPDTIVYEKYGSNLRRRLNSTGNEIILQNVADYSFSLLSNAVKINVKDTWGNEYSLIASSLVNWAQLP